MAKLLLISGFCLLAIATQAATYNDAQLLRAVRSPNYEGHYHDNQPPFPPPTFPPPPPPFIYRTHNWSGVGRDNGGAVGGVFSGAAASAQSAIPASNTAFSLAEAGAVQEKFDAQSAESDDNSGSVGFKNSGHYSSESSESGTQQLRSGSADYSKKKSGNSYSGGYSGSNSHDGSSSFSGQSNQNSASNGYGQELRRGYGQSSSFNSGYAGNSGGYGGGYKKHFKESRYSVQNGEINQQHGAGRDQRNFDEGRESQSRGFSSSQAQSSSSDNSGYYAPSQGSVQSGSNAYGYGKENRRSEVRGYEDQADGSEAFKSQQVKSAAESEQSAGYDASVSGSNNEAGYGQSQSALHGALELASQGLQAAKKSECSTCQKSTYALSNAKSNSGSAIALSIGG